MDVSSLVSDYLKDVHRYQKDKEYQKWYDKQLEANDAIYKKDIKDIVKDDKFLENYKGDPINIIDSYVKINYNERDYDVLNKVIKLLCRNEMDIYEIAVFTHNSNFVSYEKVWPQLFEGRKISLELWERIKMKCDIVQ